MFIEFFYALRKEGVPVSLVEWLTLVEALAKGLTYNSLTGFYYLARAVLIKSERYFDRFDKVFFEHFKDLETSEEIVAEAIAYLEELDLPDIPSQFREKLDPQRQMVDVDISGMRGTIQVKASELKQNLINKEAMSKSKSGMSIGDSPGMEAGGIRFGGRGGNLTAVKVAGKRKYKELRDDKLTNIRQFEMALRSLRLLNSKHEGPKNELDLDATIEATGRNAGMLNLIWERPRKNNLKVVILMDSIGSIDRHHDVCKRLFNAAHRATQFKEIKFFYFHNCLYDSIYKTPMVDKRKSIPMEEFFKTRNPEHRIIIVGDATMHPNELLKVGGAINFDEFNREPGMTWLHRFANHYPYCVWLNPVPEGWWGREPDYTTIPLVSKIFPMFELNPIGLEKAIRKIRTKNN